MDIRNVKNADDLIRYFAENLDWEIDLDDFEDIDDITYDFDAADIGLKEEAFAKITSLRQLQPLCDEQKWGIFCVEFDSDHFEVSALRKILSGLIPKRRNTADHAVWSQKDLLFLCFWGTDNHRTIGIAHFEDKETGLPQIKMISCAPGVEDFTQIRNFEERIAHLKWVQDVTNAQEWYAQWSAAFVTAYHQVIRDSASLTVKLAAEAQAIRDRILDIYAVETHDGYVHKLFADFKSHLIHDMTKQEFADMYAQTVVYGLFSARCMDKTQEDFSVQEAVCCIPNTNPFLKKLMEECLGESAERRLTFDELEVANAVDVLIHTNTDSILRDFNRQTGGGKEDPVIHFYEEFLTAYDKAQKVQRGVYYTPQPVVNFIVRAVDQILKTEFGLEDGLASEETKTVRYQRDSKRKNSKGLTTTVEDTKEVPAVQILDPATGTGTFLRQTILQIYENFKAKHKGESDAKIREAWNAYVPKHLLPRLNGFELMMAPYAVAHMKLAMVLKDTGYDFGSDQRLNVFLTNSLEEPSSDVDIFDDGSFMATLVDDPLAFESAEASRAKSNNGINVILGNPPYSISSSNKSEWILELLSSYKQGLNEKKLNLDDDYIKFIRYGEYMIHNAGKGILAYISNNSFLDSITHRRMRCELLQEFDDIYIIDLHGSVQKHEVAPDGSKDENVFDIQQSVSISIFVKKNESSQMAKVHHFDLFGLRALKYKMLNSIEFENINWTDVNYETTYYFFVPKDFSKRTTYENGFLLSELFIVYNSGVKTDRDSLFIDLDRENLTKKIQTLLGGKMTDAFKEKYNVVDSSSYKLTERIKGKEYNEKYIQTIEYRPFDYQWIYYDPVLVSRSGYSAMQHMIQNNYALIIPRQAITDNWSHVSVSKYLVDNRFHYSNKGIPVLCPLYLYETELGNNQKRPNLNMSIISNVSEKIMLTFSDNEQGDIATFTPLDLLDYIYAVLHSPRYRETYKEFLKIDFPRVPYPTDQESFRKLSAIGTKLRECHLLQCELDTAPYTFLGDGTGEVVKPEYKNGRVYISKTRYFDNVPQAQWEQYIGGYQPLQKWLKDRKKLTLSAEDIEHYKKIIAALKLTEELMQEVDEVIVI